MRSCVTCQRNKYDRSKSLRLMQPLPIPEGIISNISMDFIIGLPKSQGKEVILVVVNRLTKYDHFLGAKPPVWNKTTVAHIFIDQVYRLITRPFVSDRNTVFVSTKAGTL